MAVRKQCKAKGCRYGDARCEHPWWFDVFHGGKRHRMTVNDFAIPRMKGGEARPVTSKQEAERVWEPRFLGEVMSGRDPRVHFRPAVATGEDPLNVAGFLDLYYRRYVKPRSLRSAASVRSRIGVLKANLGELPVCALERPEPINRFKTESEYAEDAELATVHRVLEVLRTAMNWGRAQTPPLIMQSPFHKFGVTMSKKDEASRDRRLDPAEERQLLHTALHQMNTPEHQHVGPLLHDRIIARWSCAAVVERCC
jgi:hypothetical protein